MVDGNDSEDELKPLVIAIAGLPGAGKSTHAREVYCSLRAAGELVHDWKKHEKASRFCDLGHLPRGMCHSAHAEDLADSIRDGDLSVIADIQFCYVDVRQEIDILVRRMGALVHWHFFKNDAAQCIANARQRATLKPRRRLEEELRKIGEYSLQYNIPSGAEVIPVSGVAAGYNFGKECALARTKDGT